MLKIYTFAHKRPDFISLQMQSFQHIKEDFSFTVFNNASFDINRENYEKINLTCQQNNVRVEDVLKDDCVEYCQRQEASCPIFLPDGEYHNPNVACAYPLVWAWRNIISRQQDPILILDSDMFVLKDMRFSDWLSYNQLAYLPQGRPEVLEYMWNALVLANTHMLPECRNINWYCGTVNGTPVDVGGQTYHYLQAHPELKVYKIPFQHYWADDKTNFNPSDYELMGPDKSVLHYRSGSNWNGRPNEYHTAKTIWLKELLDNNRVP